LQGEAMAEGATLAVAPNKEKRPAVLALRTDELLFDPPHSHGHCWCMAISSRARLSRRLTVREHTRVVPTAFTLPGAKANKAYCYHMAAFAAAYINEITPGTLQDLPYNLADLQQVTKGKSADSNVLCHGCGLAFCVNPFHFKVASKAANDEEEHCHHFLRLCSTRRRTELFTTDICSMLHGAGDGPCWTNVYTYASMDPTRPSQSMVPFEEAVEWAEAEGEDDVPPGVV
jgi:Zinc-binding loop region of homing endonuclease